MMKKPVLATLSATNMPSVVLPSLPLAGKVYIASDNDTAGRQAAKRTADKLWLEGREIFFLSPPQTVNDFNDWLLKG